MGFSKSSSLKPTARNIARLGERATPVVMSWERLLSLVTSVSFRDALCGVEAPLFNLYSRFRSFESHSAVVAGSSGDRPLPCRSPHGGGGQRGDRASGIAVVR